MLNPIVSIVLPVYNAEEYIARTIESIQKQSVEEWELLLINDGSIDKSLEIINRYASTDCRLKIYDQTNSGPSSARNVGIFNASSRYITFIDADDQAEPFYLKSLLDTAEKESDAELVCGGYYEQSIYNKAGLPLHDFEKYRPRQILSKDEFEENLFNGLTGVLWAKLFVTKIIHKHSIILPLKLKFSEDLVFVAEYVKYISKIAICYEHIYLYNRLGEDGLSRKFDESYLDNFILFNELIANSFKGNERVVEKLKLRTAQQLIKTLKDQNTSVKNLKYFHHLILQKMGSHSFSNISGFYDRIYISLQNSGMYILAFLQQKIYQILKKFKHA